MTVHGDLELFDGYNGWQTDASCRGKGGYDDIAAGAVRAKTALVTDCGTLRRSVHDREVAGRVGKNRG